MIQSGEPARISMEEDPSKELGVVENGRVNVVGRVEREVDHL